MSSKLVDKLKFGQHKMLNMCGGQKGKRTLCRNYKFERLVKIDEASNVLL